VTKTKQKLKWNLVDNAIDFVRAAVETFFHHPVPRPERNPGYSLVDQSPETPPNDRAYKYAILHLHAGILLLLKARLFSTHESLIFATVDNPRTKQGEMRTVGLTQALARLELWAKVDIEKSDRDQVVALQRLRNQIEHYEVHLQPEEAQAVITQNVEFVYRFLRDHLSINLQDQVSARAWLMVEKLRGVEEQRREEWKAMRAAFVESYKSLSASEIVEIGENPDSRPDASRDYWNCTWCGNEESLVFWKRAWVCTDPNCRQVLDGMHCPDCRDFVPDLGDTLCIDCEEEAQDDDRRHFCRSLERRVPARKRRRSIRCCARSKPRLGRAEYGVPSGV